ncbi:polyamine aminopropyltransferase [Nitrosomonas sp. Nm166]|uniref:polyamine aminopropyltransferase n=1 Tax=Nitrosomonas sp. Nm166 TaxID=1881054 RepID=UPI0008E4A64D|nr:polyamine aminopropyltransferase [Nitrosomonas sp. Nm166]SFE90467.1 spermidine synthase [Nitrosomonas sp. Nm166]
MIRFAKKSPREIDVAISEQNGVRSLHLGGSEIQSAMRINAPNELELLYTQYMMGFLLFQPAPSHILMIGLGGGSLAKFVYHQIPQTKTTVVEINQQVISAAFNHFALPEADERLQIILADGEQYLRDYSPTIDILMVDGFHDDCQSASLCSQEFYNQAYQVLNKNGMLVVNLLSQNKNLNTYLQRIKDSFQGRVVTILSGACGNLIVFAFKHSLGRLSWKILKARAKKLEEMYDLPFSDCVSRLRESTYSHHNYIEI